MTCYIWGIRRCAEIIIFRDANTCTPVSRYQFRRYMLHLRWMYQTTLRQIPKYCTLNKCCAWIVSTLYYVIRRSGDLILAPKPTARSLIFHGFPQSLEANVATVPQIRPRTFRSTSSPVHCVVRYQPISRHYAIWITDSVLKYIANKVEVLNGYLSNTNRECQLLHCKIH
jgi:hypothetical protein